MTLEVETSSLKSSKSLTAKPLTAKSLTSKPMGMPLGKVGSTAKPSLVRMTMSHSILTAHLVYLQDSSYQPRQFKIIQLIVF